MPDHPRCGNCNFYRRGCGECLRYPPINQKVVDGVTISGDRPTVDAADWCGEWEPNCHTDIDETQTAPTGGTKEEEAS